MFSKFIADLSLPDCIIQVGTENQVADIFSGKDSKEIEKLVDIFSGPKGSNLYFLGGVKGDKGKERASDDDVTMKNYVYFDFDLRKSHPNLSDKEIKDLSKWFTSILDEDETFGSWRYIIYTGNGLHIYFFFSPILIADKVKWKLGVSELVERLQKSTGEKVDTACINLARIARLPGSFNYKSSPEKRVEILHRQEKMSDLGKLINELGDKAEKQSKIDQEAAARKVQLMYPQEVDTYKAIQQLPISDVVTRSMGWEFDGKHFFEPGSKNKSACFVPERENFLVHGGTTHLPPSQVGYRPFEFVKEVKKIDNWQTFAWFKKSYPAIEAISRKEQSKREIQVAMHSVGVGDIGSVFDELQNVNFEQLLLNKAGLDRLKFIIRGAVTRIGAFSNIGKSKLAYYLTYLLLQNGYRGMLFSTEVPRSIVLANLITIPTGQHFWDIVERRYVPPEDIRMLYRNLEIYDVTHTHNSLTNYEALLQRAFDKAKNEQELLAPSFVVIDFCQAVTPSVRGDGEYMMMSKYALEVQSMAQRLNIAVIDLSQISNEGVRDEFESVGMIPFKGSGHLYSSADVGILLKRDKKNDPSNNLMSFDIRKHKYMPPERVELECEFKKGTFKIFGSEFPGEKATVPMPFRDVFDTRVDL